MFNVIYNHWWASGNKSCCFALISHIHSRSPLFGLAIWRYPSLILMWGNCSLRFLIFSLSSSFRRPKQRRFFNVGIDFNCRSLLKSILVEWTFRFSKEFNCLMMLSRESLVIGVKPKFSFVIFLHLLLKFSHVCPRETLESQGSISKH